MSSQEIYDDFSNHYAKKSLNKEEESLSYILSITLYLLELLVLFICDYFPPRHTSTDQQISAKGLYPLDKINDCSSPPHYTRILPMILAIYIKIGNPVYPVFYGLLSFILQ